MTSDTRPVRILVVDDNAAIHADFARILGRTDPDSLAHLEADLFGATPTAAPAAHENRYELSFASQGQQAAELVSQAKSAEQPFAVAFVDVRMPPGWNGIETIQQLWKIDPDLEVVLCTAYSDFSWNEIVATVGSTDRLLILKKPFDIEEVRQFALTLSTKWQLRQVQALRMHELELTVQERLRELRESEIAREAAVRGNLAKSEFLANMSHEIRTPLNGVTGMLQLLEQSPLDGDQKDYLRVANTSIHCLTTLIQDVLDFSKIEAGKLELDEFDFNLRQMIAEVLEMMANQARAKGLQLHSELPESWPGFYQGDGNRLRQVLINLLNNAIKFTPQGHVVLRVLPQTLEAGIRELRFEIIDTGIGIPADRRNRLFQVFSQVDASTTRSFGGTGLGLALCKRLVEAQGGAIGVESEVNRGSTFWFTVRLRELDHLPEPPSAPALPGNCAHPGATPAASETEPAFDDFRVLVAEDNEINQFVIREFLKREGAQCTIAADGQQAVELALTKEFDLLIMDCQMPRMDGYEASRQIRRHEAQHSGLARNRQRLPIIALTANALIGDREQCLEAGMDEFLTKPIDRARLTASLEALGRKRQRPVTQRNPCGSAADAATCFDQDEFLNRCYGDLQTAIELVDVFTDSVPNSLEGLKQACQQRDPMRLLAITHALKGVAGNLSAKTLFELTSEFHRKHRHDSDSGLETALADAGKIRCEVERCLEDAQNLRQSLLARGANAAAP